MNQDEGLLRAAYVGAVTGVRRALDATPLLAAWDRRSLAAPRSRVAHLRSLLALHRPEDLVLLDVPWWTYESVDEVDAFLAALDGRARVLEFGAGASTVWLARRAASVSSVEHDPEWAARVEELLQEADGLRCRPTLRVVEVSASDAPVVASGAPSGRGLDFAAYVAEGAALGGPFDLLLVDGRARADSLLRSLPLVAEGGMALLDDSQRPRYRAALAAAAADGWQVRRTRGPTPCQPLPRETTLLTRAAAPSP